MEDLPTDKYQKQLKEKTTQLKNCLKNNNVDSCLKCKKIIGCEIRKNYVDAVYESMSKGQGGGFEF